MIRGTKNCQLSKYKNSFKALIYQGEFEYLADTHDSPRVPLLIKGLVKPHANDTNNSPPISLIRVGLKIKKNKKKKRKKEKKKKIKKEKKNFFNAQFGFNSRISYFSLGSTP